MNPKRIDCYLAEILTRTSIQPPMPGTMFGCRPLMRLQDSRALRYLYQRYSSMNKNAKICHIAKHPILHCNLLYAHYAGPLYPTSPTLDSSTGIAFSLTQHGFPCRIFCTADSGEAWALNYTSTPMGNIVCKSRTSRGFSVKTNAWR